MHLRFLVGIASLLVLGSVFVASSHAQDPVIVYLGDSGVLADLDASGGPGTSGVIHVGIQTPVRIAGVSLDVRAVTPGVVNFTGSTLANPSSLDGQPRWTINLPGNVSDGAVESIEGGAFIGLSSAGIGPETAAADGAYDAGIDTFTFAAINYDIVGLGRTDIELVIGRNVIGFNDQQVPIQFGVGSEIVDNVAGASAVVGSICNCIPEPSSVVLLSLAMLGLLGVGRRRR